MEQSRTEGRPGGQAARPPQSSGYSGGGYRPSSGPGGRRPYMLRKKECQFCKNRVKNIDYKIHDLLRKFMSERGKMLSSRITGTCYVHQIQLQRAIKRARFLALLPFTTIKYEA